MLVNRHTDVPRYIVSLSVTKMFDNFATMNVLLFGPRVKIADFSLTNAFSSCTVPRKIE